MTKTKRKINWWNETKAVLVVVSVVFVSYKGLVPFEITDEKIGGFQFGRLPISEDRELPMIEWVLNEVKIAGLNPDEVYCLVNGESRWKQWAYNLNTNGTTDFGLWMVNSVHKKTISVECRWDYKCSTKWAINKILRDGNYNAWYAYNNYNCKRYEI